MADARVKDFTQETAVDGSLNIGVDKAPYTNAKRITTADLKAFVWKVLVDATAITNITDEANWSDASGEYTGAFTNMVAGDVYYDSTNQIRYQYDGVQLVRWVVNNIY